MYTCSDCKKKIDSTEKRKHSGMCEGCYYRLVDSYNKEKGYAKQDALIEDAEDFEIANGQLLLIYDAVLAFDGEPKLKESTLAALRKELERRMEGGL